MNADVCKTENKVAGKTVSKEDVIAAVAQAWCTPENETKEMDTELAMAIVKNIVNITS